MKLPLFLLLGDSFLCEEKRKEIIASLEKECGPGLPVTRRSAGEVPLDSLLGEARTLPFLAPAQVFCVTEANQFTKGEIEQWQSYFNSPPAATFFIFEAESLAKGHPFLEWAGRSGRLFSLQDETQKLVAHFIREKLKSAGKKITADALELLEAKLGDSFPFLDSVLDRLILEAGERPEIDRSRVEAFEEKLGGYEGWDLVQALSERDVPKSLEILHGLLELSGEDFPSLVGLLHWQLRRFWEAKKAGRAVPFARELKGFSLEELEKALEGLFYLDWNLKSGRREGRYEIESWMVKAIG